MALRFEWDRRKADSNFKKHGVSFPEAATVFADPLSITMPILTSQYQKSALWMWVSRIEGGCSWYRTPSGATTFASSARDLQRDPSENTVLGAKVVGNIDAIKVMHLQVPPEQGLRALEGLRHRPDIEFAEFDSLAHAFGTTGSTPTTTFTPNDPYYATLYASSHYGNVAQWGPPAVSAPSAWGITEGARSTIIAIVDTGVDDTHPDLASKIVGEYSYTGSVHDGFGHGTHVAGIAAAATNNSTGVAGMCPNCGILSVKVLNDHGSGYLSDVASGIIYAAGHGARVISLSLGGSSVSQTMRSALAYAVANNALPVCAAGNSNSSTAPEPAYWYDCLSVIATDQTGAKASFSNYGVVDDVAAPGVAILSTMPTYPVTLNSYGYLSNYDALSGTSMATPAVSRNCGAGSIPKSKPDPRAGQGNHRGHGRRWGQLDT